MKLIKNLYTKINEPATDKWNDEEVLISGDSILPEFGRPIVYTEKISKLTSGKVDLSLANVFTFQPTRTTAFEFNNAINGRAHSFTLVINMVTLYQMTFPANVKWQYGDLPDIDSGGKHYILGFLTVDGGATWLASSGGDF